jgi:hypothetical protein
MKYLSAGGAASAGAGAVAGSATIGTAREQPRSSSSHERMTIGFGTGPREPVYVKRLAAIAALVLVASTASAQSSWNDVPRDKKGRPWPEHLPYRRDAPIPNGYHVETGPRSSLITAGAIIFGISYGLCVYGASRSDKDNYKVLYLPIVGPYIWAATLKNDSYGIGTLAGLLAGALQAGGTAMFFLGFIPKTQLVRNDLSMSLLPVVTPQQQGLAVVGTF